MYASNLTPEACLITQAQHIQDLLVAWLPVDRRCPPWLPHGQKKRLLFSLQSGLCSTFFCFAFKTRNGRVQQSACFQRICFMYTFDNPLAFWPEELSNLPCCFYFVYEFFSYTNLPSVPKRSSYFIAGYSEDEKGKEGVDLSWWNLFSFLSAPSKGVFSPTGTGPLIFKRCYACADFSP